MALCQFARASVGFLFLVTAGFAGQAHAQNWDGAGQLRVGAFAQGMWTDFTTLQSLPNGPAFSRSASANALGGGVVAGYDLRFGTFVVGAETDISFGDASGRLTGSNVEQFGVDFIGTLRARFGVMLHPSVLAYGTVGVAALSSQFRYTGQGNFVQTAQGALNQKDVTSTGLSIGGGAEYDAGWGILFGEYLHNDYGSWSFLNTPNGTIYKNDASGDVVRLGVKFKVGHDFDNNDYVRASRMK